MYAIIKTGGKQYKVEQGDEIYIEKLELNTSDEVVFEEIVAIGKDKKFIAGTPFVKGASVKGNVVKNGKGKKINVFTYRAKKDSKRSLGHRQPYTKVKITEISAE